MGSETKRTEVKILGLSPGQSQHSYICILSEKRGKRKIPVVVNAQDAQTIAVSMENLKISKISMFDVYKEITKQYNITNQEIYIYDVLEGKFMCRVITHNEVDEVEIEMSIADALTLALSLNMTIYAYERVLSKVGIATDENGRIIEDDTESTNGDEDVEEKTSVSIEGLQVLLDRAISEENYELAAKLRDKIDSLKNNQ